MLDALTDRQFYALWLGLSSFVCFALFRLDAWVRAKYPRNRTWPVPPKNQIAMRGNPAATNHEHVVPHGR